MDTARKLNETLICALPPASLPSASHFRRYSAEVEALLEPFVYEWTTERDGSISAEHGVRLRVGQAASVALAAWRETPVPHHPACMSEYLTHDFVLHA